MYLADMRDSEKIWRMFKETPPEDIMYIVTPSDMAESDITFVPASCGPAMVRWLGANRIRAVAGRTVRSVGHRLNPPASMRLAADDVELTTPEALIWIAVVAVLVALLA